MAVRAHYHPPSVRPDQERAADALAPFPRAVRQPTHVAHAGDPKFEIARHGTVVVEPELAVGFLLIVMTRRHGPRARRENNFGAHQTQGATDDLSASECIGTDHDTETAQRRARDAQPVPLRVTRLRDF